ncbi:hypothetical protein K7432_012264 [Basidiobolus ranarum]|uniref:ZZ-type domain-containing protein n=1 Tax=Basidiobolus ranarum TaxID=34480 RepID=A0ABR2VSI4_9FUNG
MANPANYFDDTSEAVTLREDYELIQSSLVVLRHQMHQARQDIQKLSEMRELALNDPSDYLLKLSTKAKQPPTRQQILKLPHVDFNKFQERYERIRSHLDAEESELNKKNRGTSDIAYNTSTSKDPAMKRIEFHNNFDRIVSAPTSKPDKDSLVINRQTPAYLEISSESSYLEEETQEIILEEIHTRCCNIEIECSSCLLHPLVGTYYACIECFTELSVSLCEHCYQSGYNTPFHLNASHTYCKIMAEVLQL